MRGCTGVSDLGRLMGAVTSGSGRLAALGREAASMDAGKLQRV